MFDIIYNFIADMELLIYYGIHFIVYHGGVKNKLYEYRLFGRPTFVFRYSLYIVW